MELIFFPLFLLVMGVVVFFVLKQAKVRKEHFQRLADQCRLEMDGGGFGNVVLRGLHEGYPVVFTFTPSAKNTPPYMTAGYLCQLPLTVTLRRQGLSTSFKTTFGLGRDLEIGDQAMDDAFEIDAEAETGLLRFLGDQDVRAVLLNLHSRRMCELYVTEQGLSFRRIIDESELDAQFITDTIEVLRWLSVVAYRQGAGQAQERGPEVPRLEREVGVEALLLPERTVERVESVTWFEHDDDHGGDQGQDHGDGHDHGGVQVQVQVHDHGHGDDHDHDHDYGDDHDHGDDHGDDHDHGDGDDQGDDHDHGDGDDQGDGGDVPAGREDTEQLVRWLNDYQHRDQAEEELLDMGAEAVPALVAGLENPILAYPVTELLIKADEAVHLALAAELGEIADERALTKALEVIARCKPPGCAGAVEPFMEHDSFLVRYEAERVLEAVRE